MERPSKDSKPLNWDPRTKPEPLPEEDQVLEDHFHRMHSQWEAQDEDSEDD